MEFNSNYGVVKVFTDEVGIEDKTLEQITNLSKASVAEDAHIRIMPDCHVGKRCVIGTTMKIINKVCPSLVGVDIGCGITLAKTQVDFSQHLSELDGVIHTYIPSGKNVNTQSEDISFLHKMKCWNKLSSRAQELASLSLGTLGGGNHFIEAYKGNSISVHSGSRNIGLKVAEYYQELADTILEEKKKRIFKSLIFSTPAQEREKVLLEAHKTADINDINKSFNYLEGENLEDYLHDMQIIQQYAELNRSRILSIIADKMQTTIIGKVESTHNYIDLEHNILRKGATSAQLSQLLLIPLNMKDGMLICRGKGNEDWNYSAPHGAGRLYSRTEAKSLFTLEDFLKSMQGIYSTTVSQGTIDESVFAYKDAQQIMKSIEPTVTILEKLTPIYNFKASNEAN